MVIGLILSEAWLRFGNSKSKNALLGFEQSLAHLEYFWYVFTLLSPYCSSYPVFKHRTSFGKSTFSLQLETRSLPCLTQLYSLFYINGIKIIPTEIYDLLTPSALAHFIMGDGAKSRNGLLLCTNSYKIEDVVMLINILMIRYRLNYTLRIHSSGSPMIYISTKLMPLLRSIVLPYMLPSFLYKICP